MKLKIIGSLVLGIIAFTINTSVNAEDDILNQKIYLSTQKTYEIINDSIPEIVKFKPEVIVSVAKGGWLPGCYVHGLLEKEGLKFKHYSTGVKSYTADNKTSKIVYYQKLSKELIKTELAGKRILIVDDIGDTLKTANFLINYLKDNMTNPDMSIFFVLDKDKKRDLELDIPTIVGRKISDKWVVFEWETSFFSDRDNKEINAGLDSLAFDRIVISSSVLT